MRAEGSRPASASCRRWRASKGQSRRSTGPCIGACVVPPTRRMVPTRTHRRGDPSKPADYRLLPVVERRRRRRVDPVHQTDGRRDRLGGVRLDQVANRSLDVLARQDSACRLARPRCGRDRRAVGKARINAAGHPRRRPDVAADVDEFLGLGVDRPAGHVAGQANACRPAVLLSRLSPISHVRSPDHSG